MAFYEFQVFVDTLDHDPNGYIRAYSEDIHVPWRSDRSSPSTATTPESSLGL